MENLHENKLFEKVCFTEKEIAEKEFIKCQFKQCILSKDIFRGCSFEDCTFEDCDLSLITIKNSRFNGVIFEKSKIIGVNWKDVVYPFRTQFKQCDISYSSFYNLTLKKFEFEECKIHETIFSESDLTKATFNGSDLSGSLFLNSCLNGANFINAYNYNGIDVTSSKTKKAIFSLPEAHVLLKRFDIILKE